MREDAECTFFLDIRLLHRNYSMVTPSVMIRVGFSHSRPGRRADDVRCNLARLHVDILLGMCDLFPGTSWFCNCRTSFIAYPLFAMTCTLQNSLSPSSPNSMPIPEFLSPLNGMLGWRLRC